MMTEIMVVLWKVRCYLYIPVDNLKGMEGLRCERYAKKVCSNRWPNVTVMHKFQPNGQRNTLRNENPAATTIKMRSPSRLRTIFIVTTA